MCTGNMLLKVTSCTRLAPRARSGRPAAAVGAASGTWLLVCWGSGCAEQRGACVRPAALGSSPERAGQSPERSGTKRPGSPPARVGSQMPRVGRAQGAPACQCCCDRRMCDHGSRMQAVPPRMQSANRRRARREQARFDPARQRARRAPRQRRTVRTSLSVTLTGCDAITISSRRPPRRHGRRGACCRARALRALSPPARLY